MISHYFHIYFIFATTISQDCHNYLLHFGCCSGECDDHLKPNQLSVGVKAGVEVMVHASPRWVIDHAHDKDAVFLERDVVTAFNTANPDEFLRD